MTALTDHFDTVHQKEIKGKGGAVVARVDYVGWSQVADRLDEAAPGWSFTVIGIGEDWAHGRLTIPSEDGTARSFENIGYAENADQEWKKEVLKDAVSDAFKRCAALAGVARYLYDKDAGPRYTMTTRTETSDPRGAPTRPPVVEDLGPADDEANPFDDPTSTAPIIRPEETRCPWHPNREPKQGRYGLFCSGQGGNGPLNAKGYCEWKGAA